MSSRKPRRFTKGDTVLVSGFGLDGTRLIVRKRLAAPYYDLTFAHNGNAVPGHYHEALMVAA